MLWHGLRTISRHGQEHSSSYHTIVHSCELGATHVSFGLLTHGACSDAVATDIIHQHSGRLDYYKGYVIAFWIELFTLHLFASFRNFTQFYSTKSERDRNLRKEYETQMEYRKHLQAFIDRWRYNANRGRLPHSFFSVTSSHVVVKLSCTGAGENQNLGKGWLFRLRLR